MRANEFLLELFDKQAIPLAWSKSLHTTIATGDLAHANPNDHRDLDIRFWDEGKGVAEMEFNVDGEFTVTGAGGANVIFATVIEAVKKFITDNPKINTLRFSAQEQSRARMYDTITKRVSKSLGWHVVPHEEMIANPKFQTGGGYGFAVQKGQAPVHRAHAQATQHEKFKNIWYVYSMEDPKAPVIKITGGNKSSDVEMFVHKHNKLYQHLNAMGTFASHQPPEGRKDIIDGGEFKETPKPEPRVPTPLEQKLRDKLGA
jgi:hypothetical protein